MQTQGDGGEAHTQGRGSTEWPHKDRSHDNVGGDLDGDGCLGNGRDGDGVSLDKDGRSEDWDARNGDGGKDEGRKEVGDGLGKDGDT